MKKFLSVILAAAMLLSIVIVAIVPASAADGQWTVYTKPSNYGTDENGNDIKPFIWGYEYTDDGFTTVSPDWVDQDVSPYGTVQTREPVDFSGGLYLKVLVDRFAYEDNDAWINISLWNTENIEPGKKGHGEGVQTLIRPMTDDAESNEWYYSAVEWYTGEFTQAGNSDMLNADGDIQYPVDENGDIVIEFELKEVNGLYEITINGAIAPNDVITGLYDIFPDKEAYVGITLYNSTYGSDLGLTILEFGESKENAEMPNGSDKERAVNGIVEEIAEIADASTVPAGQPAILMTGDKTNSDTKSYEGLQGDEMALNDDFTVRIVNDGNPIAFAEMKVKNDVSYDIDDFPVMMFLTKNFCLCDDPAFCYAGEPCQVYIMAGKGRTPGSGGCARTRDVDLCWEPITVGDDSYLYFYFDTSDTDNAVDFNYVAREWSGRIHGIQFEFQKMLSDAEKQTINMEWVAFFRSVEEAEAYVYSYLGVDAPGEDDTEDVTDEPTEDSAVESTEPNVENPTEEKTDAKTEKPTEEKTEPKTEEPAQSSGCGSMIGAGAAAVLATVVACGAVILKKKED